MKTNETYELNPDTPGNLRRKLNARFESLRKTIGTLIWIIAAVFSAVLVWAIYVLRNVNAADRPMSLLLVLFIVVSILFFASIKIITWKGVK